MTTPGSFLTQKHPIQLDIDAPLEIARWRIIGNVILAIPHFIVLYVMVIVLNVFTFIAWFAILFTGNIPRGMFDFMAAVFRYQWRISSFTLFMRSSYPAFDLKASDVDTGNDPASVTIPYPDRLSRGLIFIKCLLIIPTNLVLVFVGIAAEVVIVVAWFAVLFTGRWPSSMRKFIVGVQRWGLRSQAYVFLMTDKYPPFTLEP